MQRYYETKRLVLKTLDKHYADLILNYYLRNRTFFAEWDSKRDEQFYTKSYQENQLEIESADIENGNLLRLWIFKNDCYIWCY
jgi:ribosomal-protein-alanine N-acetyltransferase